MSYTEGWHYVLYRGLAKYYNPKGWHSITIPWAGTVLLYRGLARQGLGWSRQINLHATLPRARAYYLFVVLGAMYLKVFVGAIFRYFSYFGISVTFILGASDLVKFVVILLALFSLIG